MRQDLIYAMLWFGAGCAVGLGIRSIFGGDVILLCGAINIASGVIGLLIVTRNEQARKAFYGEGGRGGLVLAIPLYKKRLHTMIPEIHHATIP